MATEKRTETGRYISMSRKEVADFIGLMGAQLAGEPLIGNAAGAAATLQVTGSDGSTKKLSFVVNTEAALSCELVAENVIVLSSQATAYAINLFGAVLAGKSISCPQCSVDTDTGETYTLFTFLEPTEEQLRKAAEPKPAFKPYSFLDENGKQKHHPKKVSSTDLPTA